MPKALVIWQDGRTKMVSYHEPAPLTYTVVERVGAPLGGTDVRQGRVRNFRRSSDHRRMVIYEEPEGG